ncbi:SLC13 family permease [Orbus sturtevantii]|uniref:SLC13 family permease n=1 Tax=Orbus sturtevantii TaxID=3074109 RepID=UPI00370D1C39
MVLTITIFLLVYLAMCIGFLPGFKVDRTGAAVIGAFAMIALGVISPPNAWNAIDYRTISLLFGLMVVSASFIVSGFYSWTAARIATLRVSPSLLLAVMVCAGGLLSALLTNDVVVVAMTPLLVSVTMSRGLNPVPFLLGFCFASNTAASGSLIGSPQNMIVAQGLDISFTGLLHVAALPALLSLPIIWGILTWLYRNKWYLAKTAAPITSTAINKSQSSLDITETVKAGIITLLVIIAFIATSIPRELIAFGAAGFLLLNRTISTNDMLKHVDGNLLLLIMGLFIVNAAFSSTGLPQSLLNDLKHIGIDLNNPIILFLVTGILSNIIGNNPSVMLLVPFLHHGANNDALGAALVLGSGFSSNMFVFGSLAGIIVVEQAKQYGVKISFIEFMKSGFIITVSCMLMAAVNILLLSSL